MKQEIDSFWPATRQHWREWLQEHHDKKQAVWLIYSKKKSATPGITYNEAVEEALCFGWIDSRAKPIDEETYMQFFSRRKPAGGWSKVNKERIQRLIQAGLMTSAGLACIDRAKQNGSWLMLDEIEALIIPADLEQAWQERPKAKSYFSSLSRSDKRTILQWLVLAKRAVTRQNRIDELIELADQQQKPKLLRWTKKHPTL
ncbi:YdeI/OmpD-associated family protein [Spirosoma flavum]|uniref:YdeI family protein n=1 Tax=Spirosoma flavum TaxID=2048557 RepID=A0ABW6AHY5_9BACT